MVSSSSCWLFLFLVGNAVVEHIDAFTPVVRTLPAHSSRSSSTIKRNSKNNAATTTSAPPPQVLASEGDWNAYLDLQTTGLIYYFNGKTGESRWDAPSGTFPVITLTGRNKRLALQQQQVYQGLNGQQLDDDAAEKERKRQERRAARKRREAEAAAAAASDLESTIAPAEEQPDWFGGLFGGTTTASSTTTTSASSTTSEEANWFGVADAAPASVAPKMPNFFTNMMDTFRNDAPSSSSSSAVLDMPVTESAPPLEEVVAAPPTVRVDLVSAVLPAPSKRLWGGEDAVFCAGRVFGVFDGVTSAEKALGKPLYSKFLAAQFAALPEEENWSMPRLVARLTAAAQEANVKATGATTAMVAAITDNGFLRCLNVGDSTLLVIRPFFLETLSSTPTSAKEIGVRIVAKSREIIHYWECPYQLSADSPDQPAQGTKLNVELLPGDLCIMGSDGIFDNLSDRDVIKLLTSTPGFATLIRGSNAVVPDASTAQRLLKTACQKICDVARQVSLDATAVTPYAKEAKLQRDPQYATGLGGKVDDISCIVARYDVT
jgi:protein phosphatase PTC7